MDEVPTGRNRRRRVALLAGLVLVGALLVSTGWWLSSPRLSAEELALVGTWRDAAPTPGGANSETVYLPDRSLLTRDTDPATGAPRESGRDRRWRLAGGRLESYSTLRPLPLRQADTVQFARLEWLDPDRIGLTRPSGASRTLERVR